MSHVHHDDYVSASVPMNPYNSMDTAEKKQSTTVKYQRYLFKLTLLACFLKLSVYLWSNEIGNIRPRFITGYSRTVNKFLTSHPYSIKNID